MNTYDTVLFDLDGTLTESGEGIIKSVQYALEQFGIVEADTERLREFVGPPLVGSFQKFYHFDQEQAKQALAYYRERFSTIGIFENALYPGVKEMLDALYGKGVHLALASSKPEKYVLQILEHFQIASYFSVVTGSTMDDKRTKKVDMIEETLKRLGKETEREKVLMVGDTEHDVIGAKEAGIDCAAVTYGYGTLEEIEMEEPVLIAGSVEELKHELLNYCE